MDILDKLKSQIGDDVQHIFDQEALFKSARDEITALRARLAEVVKERDAARADLERDRSTVIVAVNSIRDEIASRSWLLEGRGPYEWDDDRYRAEFSAALDAIKMPIEKLRAIGRDWSNCPTDPDAIQAARIDWKARAERAEAALATARRVALEEAANLNGWWLVMTAHGEPDGTYCSVKPIEEPSAVKYVSADAIRALANEAET